MDLRALVHREPPLVRAAEDAWHGHMGTEPESTMGKALDFLEATP